jgi:aryl-alcohol dehydrogenase-like predicted oxidoreductase
MAAAAGAREAAARARAASETHDLDPAHITARLERSLKRLRRDNVDLFLLHSPPRAALEDHALFDLLDTLKERGLARLVGVSCQTTGDAKWVLDQGRIDALQIPLRSSELGSLSDFLAQAQTAGVGVIAREVLGGEDPKTALPPLLNDPRILVALIGTTSAKHLTENLKIAKGG